MVLQVLKDYVESFPFATPHVAVAESKSWAASSAGMSTQHVEALHNVQFQEYIRMLRFFVFVK